MPDSDQTYEIQAALTAASRAATARDIKLPAGKLVIRDTLTVTKTMGLKFSGSGGPNRSPSPSWNAGRVCTILDWQGPPHKPILQLDGCTCTVLEGLNFTGMASQGVLITHGAGSLNLAIRDCGFMGMAVGVQCGTFQGEQTCANITYDNCHWERCSEACVRLMNSQSLEHLFLRPKFALSPIGIDVAAGGDVSLIGGGSYELGTLLRLGNVASNTRGFDVTSFRVDGDGTRTKLLAFADVKAAKTYGPVVYRNLTQNAGQLNSDGPLFDVAPGCRCVTEDCSFHAEPKLKGGQLAHIYSTAKAAGEFHCIRGDGLAGDSLKQYLTLKGPRSYYEFTRTGNIFGACGSVHNFPEVVQK